MISRTGGQGFFAAHYDWIVAGVGVLALAAGGWFYLQSQAEDANAETAAEVASLKSTQPKDSQRVKDVDLTAFREAVHLAKSPKTIPEISEKDGSFLASDRRVVCKGKECGKVVPGSAKACPFCKTALEEAKPVVLDADGDGMPDEWERKFGLNPGDASDAEGDLDKDGFTNLEEFQAKTDPTNAKDHPDYLDSIRIRSELKQTYLPFVFRAANKVRDGWKCDFFDAKQKDDYGRMGRTFRTLVGEEIGAAEKKPTGYVLKAYVPKETKMEKPGMKGMFTTVDVSEVTVVRKSDGKVIDGVRRAKKNTDTPKPIDMQATLDYERGGTKGPFDVVKGTEIDLNGTKFKVTDITKDDKGNKRVKVTFENVLTGKRRTLEALEP